MFTWRGIPGGHGTFSNLVNNIVHIIMYTYYMLSAMGPQYQKYLWWKKHLTLLQLVSQRNSDTVMSHSSKPHFARSAKNLGCLFC
jgi:GNS1/SUR4 family.